MLKFLKWLALLLAVIALGFLLWVFSSTLQPQSQQREAVTGMADTGRASSGQSTEVKLPKSGSTLRLLSWNIQFLAGNKNNHFFYSGGQDPWPSLHRTKQTAEQIAAVIYQHQPDIVLFQEVDDNAKRTHYRDQQKMLSDLLPQYPFQTSTYYWQAGFVPHPKIMGRVGMKLVIMSKYPISSATRFSLPSITSDDVIKRQFNLKRAVQLAKIPVAGGQQLNIFNTHLSAFAAGSDTMERQVEKVTKLLVNADEPWVIGGDFNLLPHQQAFSTLSADQRAYYNPVKTELTPLFSLFGSVPSLAQTQSQEQHHWFTYMPSSDSGRIPDRTIDYVFYSSQLTLGEHQVINSEKTRQIADHLPILIDVTLP